MTCTVLYAEVRKILFCSLLTPSGHLLHLDNIHRAHITFSCWAMSDDLSES